MVFFSVCVIVWSIEWNQTNYRCLPGKRKRNLFWDLIISKVPRSDTIYSMGIEWHSPVSISVSRAPLFAKGWHSMSLRGQFCQIWWQPLRRLMTYRGKEWNCKDGPDGIVTEPRIRLALLWPNRPPYNRLNTQYPDHILDLPTYSSRAMIVWLLEITAGLYTGGVGHTSYLSRTPRIYSCTFFWPV